MKAFLKNPTRTIKLSDSCRKKIRKEPDFLRDVALSHLLIAVDCLRTNRHNVQCLYHEWKKGTHFTDHNPPKGTTVAGVPHERKMNLETPGSDAEGEEDGKELIVLAEGFMNCGCSLYAGVLDFVFFKTGSITSPTTGITDVGGVGGPYMDPRTRQFVINEWESASGLTLYDLFAYKDSEEMVAMRRSAGASAEEKARKARLAKAPKGKTRTKGKAEEETEDEDDEEIELHGSLLVRNTKADVLKAQIERLTMKLKASEDATAAEDEKKKKKAAKAAEGKGYVEVE